MLTRVELAKMIDHTLIRPTVTRAEIIGLCEEGKRYGFCSVVVPPIYVPLAAEHMKGSKVELGAVVGFPLGYYLPEVKIMETVLALRDGATEIDMVMNISAMKTKDYSLLQKDIEGVVCAARGALVKVIIETCYLTEEEKIKACQIVADSGAHFVKTSTGLAEGGATLEDVRLLRRHLPMALGVKAAGGIRDCKTALAMIEAGASRIGTSAGPTIIESCEP